MRNIHDSQHYNTPAARRFGIRADALTFTADPFYNDPEECVRFIRDALIVIADGKIESVGPCPADRDLMPEHTVSYPGKLLMPGLIDCHCHYVQTPMIGSYGDTLLSWLNQYTFPTEQHFSNPAVAADAARVFFDQILSQGTTTAAVFATTYPVSADAFFAESERRGTRMICGKVLQDRNLPEGLRDKSARQSVEESEELLLRWHGRGRQLYAVVPRFAPTSTDLQLTLAGELYQKYLDRGVYMHTHLGESDEEIAWVHDLFPDAESYTDVYRRFGLLGPRSIMAHCCVMKPGEWQLLSESGAAAVHCPASNLFLGDAQFRWWEAKDPLRPVKTGMGTDVGGGTSFSIVRNLGEAYKVGMLGGHSLSAFRAFYLATRGGAEALGLADRIGSIEPGMEADLCVLDLDLPFVSWRLDRARTLEEKLFCLQTLAPDNLVEATYVAGRCVYSKS